MPVPHRTVKISNGAAPHRTVSVSSNTVRFGTAPYRNSAVRCGAETVQHRITTSYLRVYYIVDIVLSELNIPLLPTFTTFAIRKVILFKR